MGAIIRFVRTVVTHVAFWVLGFGVGYDTGYQDAKEGRDRHGRQGQP